MLTATSLSLVMLACSTAAASALATPPRGVLGPPAHFDGLKVGSQFLSVSRECSITGDAVNFEVVKLASRPACFHIGGLLSAAECNQIVAAADAAGMDQATTAGGDARNNCGVAWLPLVSDDTATAVSVACEQLLLQPDVLEPSSWSNGGRFENMQVLKYTEGGEFKLHYDANEQEHRMLTVLLYLNGVGETWFPLALRDPADAASVENQNPPRVAALAAARQLSPRRDGLTVAPKIGDAVAFYNLLDGGAGQVDRLSLHAGLPAPGVKSVAALWYHVDLKQGDDGAAGLTPLAVGVGPAAKSYPGQGEKAAH